MLSHVTSFKGSFPPEASVSSVGKDIEDTTWTLVRLPSVDVDAAAAAPDSSELLVRSPGGASLK